MVSFGLDSLSWDSFSGGPTMSEIREIRDTTQLTGIRSTWATLLADTEGSDFFRTLDYLEAYWRHYGEDQRPRVLVMFSGGQPTGIVPLVVRGVRSGFDRLRVLTYPLDNAAIFQGPIGPDPAGTLGQALRQIRKTKDWDYLEFRGVAAGAAKDYAADAMVRVGLSCDARPHGEAKQVSITGHWDAYWTSRPSGWRAECLRNELRLERIGQLEHLRYRPRGMLCGEEDPRWDLFELCEAIQRRGAVEPSNAQDRAFARDLHAVGARSGSLDLNLLLVGGRLAAFQWNFIHQGHVSSLRRGCHPDFAMFDASSVLMHRVLEDSWKRRDLVFDLLSAAVPTELPWINETRMNWRLSYFPPELSRMQVLRLKNTESCDPKVA